MAVRAAALTIYLLAGQALFAAPLAGALASGRSLRYLSGPHRQRAILADLLVPLVVAALVLLFT
jgi:hypothetical protein